MIQNDRFNFAAIRKLVNDGFATYEPVYGKDEKLVTMIVKDLAGEIIYYQNVKEEDRDKPDPFKSDLI